MRTQDTPVRRGIRVGLRAAAGLFGALLVLLPALPASADNTDFGKIGDVYSPDGLSLPLSILLYVGIPAVGFLIAGVLALWSAKSSSQRYRPGRPWNKEPVWFGDESALEREPERAALPVREVEVAAGEAFSREHHDRIERARRGAESQTGMRFWVRVADVDGNLKLEAEHLLANLIDSPREAAVLLLIAPGQRRLEVMTTSMARRRISDQAVGLAVLTMTSTFAVGDLVGGIVNGLRQLADAAGRAPVVATEIDRGQLEPAPR